MRRLTKIAIATIGVITLTTIVRHEPRRPEPVYGGKTIGYWIASSGRCYESAELAGLPKTPDFDSRAIPYLLRALEKREHVLDKAYRQLWYSLPQHVRSFLPRATSAQLTRCSAVSFLQQAGGQAALPALLRAMRTDCSPMVRESALIAVVSLTFRDADALRAAACEALGDWSPSVRKSAAYALSLGGPSARSAAPSLVRCLSDEDSSVRVSAARALKAIAPDIAPEAVATVEAERRQGW